MNKHSAIRPETRRAGRGPHPKITQASADLGENALWTFWRSTVPTIGTGILASFRMSFNIWSDGFFMALFLGAPEGALWVETGPRGSDRRETAKGLEAIHDGL